MCLNPETAFKTVRFMIVDDDEVSVMAIQRAMKNLSLANPVLVAENGLLALEQLHQSMDAHGKLPPFIITLDLNMPRMNGLEFLNAVRENPALKKLLVFVLTTSDAPTDISAAYEKNIAGYIVKDNVTETLRDALAMLKDYSQLVVIPD